MGWASEDWTAWTPVAWVQGAQVEWLPLLGSSALGGQWQLPLGRALTAPGQARWEMLVLPASSAFASIGQRGAPMSCTELAKWIHAQLSTARHTVSAKPFLPPGH